MNANRCVALDPGTSFFQVAEKNEDGEIELKTIRNVFVELMNYDEDDIEQILKQNNWQYVKDEDNYYVIGDSALKFARIFPGVEIRRPMQNGVLNKGENKKMLVMASIVENAIGGAEDNNSICCYCVSASPVDCSIDNIFHKSRLEGIIKRLGFIPKCINEAMGIVFSEKPFSYEPEEKVPFSGLTISWGAGRTNVAFAYRGLEVVGMSCNKGGDSIDYKVAEQTDSELSHIIQKKETKLDLSSDENDDDDVIFALKSYYQNLVSYVFKNFISEFKKIKTNFEHPVDVILAGGTSSVPGFRDMVESVVSTLDLPFKIKEIKMSKDPRNSVVKGLLIQATLSQKKLNQN